jgi:hypothetical protein
LLVVVDMIRLPQHTLTLLLSPLLLPLALLLLLLPLLLLLLSPLLPLPWLPP